jgi:hypothetical protein
MSKSTKPEPDDTPEKTAADPGQPPTTSSEGASGASSSPAAESSASSTDADTPTDAPVDTSTPATSDSSGADDSTGSGVDDGVSLSPNPDGVPSGLADEADDTPAEVQVNDEVQVDTIANPAPLDPPTTAFGSRFRAQHDGGVVKVAASGAGYVGGWALEFEIDALDELIDVLTLLRGSVSTAGSDD